MERGGKRDPIPERKGKRNVMNVKGKNVLKNVLMNILEVL